MYITEREMLLLLGIVAIVATYFVTEWEFRQAEEEMEKMEKQVLRSREFHSETLEEMDKNKVYRW